MTQSTITLLLSPLTLLSVFCDGKGTGTTNNRDDYDVSYFFFPRILCVGGFDYWSNENQRLTRIRIFSVRPSPRQTNHLHHLVIVVTHNIIDDRPHHRFSLDDDIVEADHSNTIILGEE